MPRARMDELSGRLFASGALGLSEDFLPGRRPEPRQPWDPPGPDPEPDPILVAAWFDDPDEDAISGWVSAFGGSAWADVEERDWEAESRAGFPPVLAAPGLWIAPPWDAPPGALIVDPGRGFGTGHHPSTRTALELLVRSGITSGTALDVGCGSGILALAAERCGLTAEGIDVEPAAVQDAAHNAALNGSRASFSTRPLAELSGPYTLVLANLHAELLVELAPALVARTGQALIVAGILADREGLVRNALAPSLRCVDREIEDEWVAATWVRSP